MLKRTLIAAILLILSLSILTHAGAEDAKAASTPDQLRGQIDRIIKETDLDGGTLGVYIQDRKSGNVLYALNEKTPLKPASCNKIQTTAAALYYLGPDYRYRTHVYANGPVIRKTLQGDLIVRGSGDPTISARFEKNKDDITATFKRWAEEIEDHGIHKVNGRLIGDDNYFDDDYFGIGWYPKERAEWYCAEISALSFNDNCVDLVFRGGRSPGSNSSYDINPKTTYVTIKNDVRTRRQNSRENIGFFRNDQENIIQARGGVRPGSRKTAWAAIYNPTAFFISVMRDTLTEKDVHIAGEAVDIDSLDDSSGIANYRDTATTVATRVSPPLSKIIQVINNNSQNFYAESVLKTLGVKIKGSGSFEGGCAAVEACLRKEGLWMEGTVMIDGSGLSWHNRVPAEQLVKIIRWVRANPDWAALYLDSLPQGGKRGTLSGRFQYSPEAKDAGLRIFGKTGYIGGVRSISGILFTQNGTEIHFSLIANDFGIRDSEVIRLLDEIAVACAQSTF